MSRLFNQLQRLWDSPTFMTWLNTGSRVASLLVVLPLVLRTFRPADISLYYLFSGVISLQLICGTGFVPTLSRFVTFVLAGARLGDLEANRLGGKGESVAGREFDDGTLASLMSTMRRTFYWVVLVSTPLAGLVGTWFLAKPVAESANSVASWAAWAVVLATTPFVLLGGRYSAFLQGANRIALDQRWSALFVIFGALSGFLVMLLGGGLLALVSANQIWQVAGFFRLRWLAKKTIQSIAPQLPEKKPDMRFFKAIWPASWRSLIGILASNGITAMLGLVFAQFLESKSLAELLFGVRIMALIAEISRAPFYSRIPHLNSLRAGGEIVGLTAVAGRSMRLAYGSFVVMALAAPVLAEFLLPFIGSQIEFPSPSFWFWLAGAHLVERMGAMHIQLYSTTNHIIWHWLNGVCGLFWIGLLAVLLPVYGLMAYPWAMLAAYSISYAPIAVYYSMRSIKVGYFAFESRTFLPAAASYVLGALSLGVWLRP